MNVKKININQSETSYYIASDNGYLYVGVATPDTNPGTPDVHVFYIASEGTYTNFSGITVDKGELAVLKWNGSWSKQSLKVGLPPNELNISYLFPTNGEGGTNQYTLAGAIAQVPSEYRTIVGLKITFINNTTSLTETWEYKGGTFTAIGRWKPSNNSNVIPLNTIGYLNISGTKITYTYNNSLYSYSQIYPVVDRIRITANNTLKNVVTIAYLNKNKEFLPDISVTTCDYNEEIIELNKEAAYFVICGITNFTKVEIVESVNYRTIQELGYIKEIFNIPKYNLLDNVEIVRGYYLDGSKNWEPTFHYAFCYTDYIEVIGGMTLFTWCKRQLNVSGIIVYNSEKNVIKSYTEGSIFLYEEIILPQEAKFIRLSGEITTFPTATIKTFKPLNLFSDEKETIIEKTIDVSIKGYIVADGGSKNNEVIDGNWRMSDYEYIHGIKSLDYDITGHAIVCPMRFYDENKNPFPQALSPSASQITGNISVPDNAYYVRVSGHIDKVIVKYETTETIINKQYEEKQSLINTIANIDIYKCSMPKYPMSINMFRKILFIGDSVTAGAIADAVSSATHGEKDAPTLSYPTRVQQITGIECINNGHSGISVYGWLSKFGQDGYGNNISDVQLAVIELGWNQLFNDTNGWSTTQENFEQRLQDEVKQYGDNYQSYDISNQSPIASYCKLIKELQNANPNMAIICVASMGWNYATVSYVKQISEWAGDGVLFADVSKYLPDGNDNIHFTAKGYCEKAMIIIDVFNKVINDNFDNVAKMIYQNNPFVN